MDNGIAPECYSKDHELVREESESAHKRFKDQLDTARRERSMNISQMTLTADAGPALTARVKDEKQNLTINTMVRFAAAVGKRLEINLVDPA